MRRFLSAFLLVAMSATASFAGTAPQVSARPTARISAKVDTKSSTRLAGTISGKVGLSKDLGRASGTQVLKGLHLVLQSSPEQEAALHELLDQQQDKNSPNFHKWETPETFQSNFGIADADVAAVKDWLASQGLTVDGVGLGGRIITFSGNVKSLETAFSTEMHSYSLNGETAVSNATEVSIPSALSNVVIGPAKLNNFSDKRNATYKQVALGKDGNYYPVIPGTNKPDYTSLSSGNHFIAPADFATIYNTKPLLAAGINGKGIKIGVVGQTAIDPADTQIFRSLFGLPVNNPTIIGGFDNPQIDPDDVEADLDVEWSGAVAPFASVIFAPEGYGFYGGGGIDGSALWYVNNNNVDIITMSYGGCEQANGASGAAEWNTLWEQAAAQGQSVFVSSGDSSATGCASSGSTTTSTSTFTYGVNALGSSAYNVAVGGSMFNEGSYAEGLKTGPTKYWGPGGVSPYGTALSYIPESVMSDGAFNQVLGGAVAKSQGNPGVFGGGGGVSQFVARPPWQTGIGITAADPAGPTFTLAGAIPAGTPHRLVPDVALIGSLSHDDAIVCYETSCTSDPATGAVTGIGAVGGTSVATPVWASVMALIDQKNGGRQGNPNYFFYKLAAAEPSIAACASQENPLPAATCNFNDIITGDNYSPRTATGLYVPPVLDSNGNVVTPGFVQGTKGTDYLGFAATQGYDEASGLGTPNVTNLANNWTTVAFNSTTTKLTLTPTTTTHGVAITATATVTAGSGTPTGDVSLIANTVNGQQNVIKLSAGVATGQIVSLPGGTYTVTAYYAGDGTYAPSTSAPVSVTIAKESSNVYGETEYISSQGGATQGVSGYTYGQPVFISAIVQGNSATSLGPDNQPNTGSPTGNLTYTLTQNGTALPTYISPLDAAGITYLLAGGTFPYYYIYQNYPLLGVGAYTARMDYAGDNSFNPSTTTVGFVINKANSTPTLLVRTPYIKSGGTATIVVTSPAATGGISLTGTAYQTGAYPTSTVTLTDTTTNVTLGSGKLVNGTLTINTNLIVTAGTHTIQATTTGDSNYNAGTSLTGTVTVTTSTVPTVTVTSTTATPVVLGTTSVTATVSPAATGTVSFYDNGVYYAQATASGTTGVATYSATTWTAGTHSITAKFNGVTTVAASEVSPAYTLTVAKNQPSITLSVARNVVPTAPVLLQSRISTNPNYLAFAATANPAPSGSVNYYDNGVLIGSAPIVYDNSFETYSATYSYTPSAGTHNYTAQYPGDANYLASALTGTAVVNSNVPGFSLAATPTSLTLPQGQAGLVTIAATGISNWAGTITLACTGGLPTYAACNFSSGITLLGSTFPASGAETKSAVISITTVAPTPLVHSGLFWIPALFFAAFLIVRRKQMSLTTRRLMMMALLVCGSLSLSGCGGKVIPHDGIENGTPTGTYNVVVTATGTGATTAAGNVTQTITIPVTVTTAY